MVISYKRRVHKQDIKSHLTSRKIPWYAIKDSSGILPQKVIHKSFPTFHKKSYLNFDVSSTDAQ